MFRPPTDDVRIDDIRPLIPPAILMEEIHPGEDAIARITDARVTCRGRSRSARPRVGQDGRLSVNV